MKALSVLFLLLVSVFLVASDSKREANAASSSDPKPMRRFFDAAINWITSRTLLALILLYLFFNGFGIILICIGYSI